MSHSWKLQYRQECKKLSARQVMNREHKNSPWEQGGVIPPFVDTWRISSVSYHTATLSNVVRHMLPIAWVTSRLRLVPFTCYKRTRDIQLDDAAEARYVASSAHHASLQDLDSKTTTGRLDGKSSVERITLQQKGTSMGSEEFRLFECVLCS